VGVTSRINIGWKIFSTNQIKLEDRFEPFQFKAGN
jgi:hypothetical protein